jgi:hypothetical protein
MPVAEEGKNKPKAKLIPARGSQFLITISSLQGRRRQAGEKRGLRKQKEDSSILRMFGMT